MPVESTTVATGFNILVGGQALSHQASLISLVIHHSVNRIPFARVVLLDGNTSQADFPISNEETLIPGAEVQINASVNGTEMPVFKGIITKHGIKFNKEEQPKIEFECKDAAVKLTGIRKNKIFTDQKDSEIIESIIDEWAIDKDIESTSVSHKEMVQYNSSDWDFIMFRAESNGKWLVVNQGKISMKTPATDTAVRTINIAGDAYEYEAEFDARDQYASVTSKTWSYANQEVTESESTDPALNGPGNIEPSQLGDALGWPAYEQRHGGSLTETENQAWADSRLVFSRLSKIQGRVRISGDSSVVPGCTVNFQGFGERFNGDAIVTGVNHYYNNESGWYSDIQFGISKELFSEKYDNISEKPASGLLPPVLGLQIGVVTAIHDDPDGENRIKVKMPMVDAEGEGIWARMISPDAGAEHGWVFYPEIGDEVALGFFNDDPRNPVILGKLYSSSQPPLIEAAEDNFQKGIFTTSGLKLIFDDEKSTITLETPGGHSIVVDDGETSIIVTDSSGNTATLSADGIALESAADFNIKATGDVNIEGVNVNIKASAQLKAEGSGGAELSSSGSTTVKGSIVQIN